MHFSHDKLERNAVETVHTTRPKEKVNPSRQITMLLGPMVRTTTLDRMVYTVLL